MKSILGVGMIFMIGLAGCDNNVANDEPSNPAILKDSSILDDGSEKIKAEQLVEDIVGNYEVKNNSGVPIIKVNHDEINPDGMTIHNQEMDVIIFNDPSCESCPTIQKQFKTIGIEYSFAPVAFYSENGLDKVGATICNQKGLEDPSEACSKLVKGMVENTGWLMKQGAVDLPAVLLGNGWLLESLSETSDISAILEFDR